MSIKAQLDNMVGKLYLVEKEQERIVSWEFQADDRIVVRTDIKEHVFTMTNIQEKISFFLPVEEEKRGGITNTGIAGYELVLSNGGAQNLKAILMDNIRQVQQNKDYIPQAQEIAKNVNSIIDLAKAEIDFIKVASGRKS